MRGASWALENVLEPNADADIAVYAIWFDMFPGDRRQAWQKDLMDDPRVVHYWDADRLVGRWFKQHVWPEAPGGSITWDTWFLFGPDAVWDETPAPLFDKGRTIIATRDELKKSTNSIIAQ